MKKKCIAVFGLGPYQLYGIKDLKLKYKIIGFDENKKAAGIKYVNFFYDLNISNKKKILEKCKYHNVKHVFCFSSDYALDTILYICRNLKLDSFKKYFAAKKASKKNVLKKILIKNKINTPKYYMSELSKINIKSNNKRYIIKPSNSSGSRGVFSINSKAQLKKKLLTFQKNYKDKKLIIEEFIQGKLYAIDGIYFKNKFIPFSLSLKTKKNSFSDKTIIVNYPDNKLILKSSELAQKSCRALRTPDTLVHLEFIRCSKTGKLYLIDLGLRGAGTFIYGSLIPKIISKNTARIAIDLDINNKFPTFEKNSNCFFMYFVTPNKNIYYKGLNKSYLNKIPIKPFKVINLRKKNSLVELTYSSYDRLALIIYKFSNYEKLKNSLNELKKKLLDKKIIINS